MAALIPVSLQIVAAAIAGALALGSIGTALIVAGASLVGGYIASRFNRQKDKAQKIRGNYVSTSNTIPVVYGTRRIGTNDVFVEVGTKGEVGDNGGKYLWIVSVLSEGETEAIKQYDFEGTLYDEIYINSKALWKYKNEYKNDPDLIHHTFYNGSSTQTSDPEITLGTSGKFDDALQNRSYIVFRFKLGKKSPFNMVPAREIVLKGIKCKDTRTSLVEYTENPALILYNYLVNTRYGAGWEETKINTASFNEVATYCETYDWELNYIISSQVSAQSIIDDLLGHFRGTLHWYDGELILGYTDLRVNPVVYDIEDKHIVVDSKRKSIVTVSQPSRFNMPDGVIANYVDPRNNWVSDRITIGEKYFGLLTTINFDGYTSRRMAREMGLYVLERQRLSRSYTLSLRSDLVALDTHDVITITSSELGLTQQLARIQANNITQDGMISLMAILESDSLYNVTYEEDTSQIYDVDFPSISDPPPRVENVSIAEEVYYTRERSFVRLIISFDEPSGYPWFDHVDVYVGFPDVSVSPPVAPTDDEHKLIFSASDDFQIDPAEEYNVEDGSGHYYIRLNSVSSYGVEQEDAYSARINYKVIGVSGVYPTCPTHLNVVVNSTSVDLSSYIPRTQDIAGYEVRLGPTWLGAIFITFKSAPYVSFNNVKPGEHIFWLNTQHKNGTYCQTPVSAEAIIEDPPPGTYLFFSQVVDYSTGTGSEIDVSGVYPNQQMSVDHSSGEPYTGTYESTVIDTNNLNTEEKMVVYVEFKFTVTGGGVSWIDLATPITTWEEFAYDSVLGRWKTWDEVVGDTSRRVAAKLEVGIDYSDSPTGPWESVDRLELLTALVTGRYIKVRYTLTDINDSSYITIDESTLKAAYLEKSLLIRP